MRESAAAANAIGQEQPCRVKLRLWRYNPYDSAPPKQAGGAAAHAPKKRAESAVSAAANEQGGAHVAAGAVELEDGAVQPMNSVPSPPVPQATTVAQGELASPLHTPLVGFVREAVVPHPLCCQQAAALNHLSCLWGAGRGDTMP